MDHDQAESEEGLQNLIKILDEHFKPHTFMRKMSLWREFRKLEKTAEISWNEYVKKMKRLRSDLQHQNIEISDELFCIALIDGSNFYPGVKLSVESMARNVNPNRELTLKGTEEAILRMRTTEDENNRKEILVVENDPTDEQREINWTRYHRGQRRFRSNDMRGRGRGNYAGRGGLKRKQGCYTCGKWDHHA